MHDGEVRQAIKQDISISDKNLSYDVSAGKGDISQTFLLIDHYDSKNDSVREFLYSVIEKANKSYLKMGIWQAEKLNKLLDKEIEYHEPDLSMNCMYGERWAETAKDELDDIIEKYEIESLEWCADELERISDRDAQTEITQFKEGEERDISPDTEFLVETTLEHYRDLDLITEEFYQGGTSTLH